MLNINKENKREQIHFACIDDLVPEDHLLRDVEEALDFSFIYDEVRSLYSEETGRPSVDPVVLFKIVLIQYLFGIRSMRQTIKEIEVNTAYRWFLGYDLMEKIPHFTTFGKNYERRFKGTSIFERIFSEILLEAVKSGFVDESAIFIDGTHIKANANRRKSIKKKVRVQAKQYEKKLKEEIAQDRKEHGKKELKDKDEDDPEEKIITESTTDPESGMFNKGEHKKDFAYTANVACDKHNFILGFELAPGNTHDSRMFNPLYEKVVKQFPKVEVVAIDAGYKIPWIMKTIFDDGRYPAVPYKRPMTKKGFLKKYEFVYDEYYDCVICPNNTILKYSTTNREGYQEYKSDAKICKTCPYLNECTHSKNNTKVLTRHVWEEYIEKAEDFRHSSKGKEIYTMRSQTIERVFADAKEKHGMRYTKLKGLEKVNLQVLLTFASMNLKKLAMWKRKAKFQGPNKPFCLDFFLLLKTQV